ncbi:MAG: CHAD domain-containing protein [Acidimicrobiales bacterium]|nr:CHAD domain-containing protein [Acidimicrobiales bacterium]
MDYTIDPSAPLGDEVRRIGAVQVEAALAVLDDPGNDVVAAVHDCRKRGKKLRGLARLVRPGLGDDYRRANILFREAARELSELRDAHALLATFDVLVAAPPAPLPGDGLGPVRAELQRRSRDASERARPDAVELDRARTLLEDARRLVETWELDDDFDVVAAGVAKTYGRGRAALEAAISDPSGENFHEYRKRTKYTWYHARLLEELAPSVLGPLAAALHDLSDVLGDEHDLAVLDQQLVAEPAAFGGDDTVDAARVLIAVRRTALQDRAVRLGRRLHAETPKAFVRRLGAYWGAWHEYGEELDAGEIADVWPPVADDLDQLTVEKLRQRARDKDVEGRSDLRRSELIGALRAET